MVDSDVAVLQLVVTKLRDGLAKRSLFITKSFRLVGIMLADDFLDGDGASHGCLRPHGGCDRTKSESCRAPDRIEKRRTYLPFVKKVLERLEMFNLLLHHMLDLRAGGVVAKDGQLSAIDLLGGTLAGVIDPQKRSMSRRPATGLPKAVVLVSVMSVSLHGRQE